MPSMEIIFRKSFKAVFGKKPLGIVAHACDPSSWEVEAGEPGQGHPRLL